MREVPSRTLPRGPLVECYHYLVLFETSWSLPLGTRWAYCGVFWDWRILRLAYFEIGVFLDWRILRLAYFEIGVFCWMLLSKWSKLQNVWNFSPEIEVFSSKIALSSLRLKCQQKFACSYLKEGALNLRNLFKWGVFFKGNHIFKLSKMYHFMRHLLPLRYLSSVGTICNMQNNTAVRD